MNATRLNPVSPLLAALLVAVLVFASPAPGLCQEAPEPDKPAIDIDTLGTLATFVSLRKRLLLDIEILNNQLEAETSEAEKKEIRTQLEKLREELNTTNQNIENVAAGVDLGSLLSDKSEEFDFQKELFGLLKPALDEMKQMTAHVRQKSALREKIAFLEKRLQVIDQALENIRALKAGADDEAVTKSLVATEKRWADQQAFMQGELQAASLQLEKLEAAETSLTEASQSYLKSFFTKRGRYLGAALLVVVLIVLFSRLSYRAMQRFLPGFRKKHRSFRVRLTELAHRLVTLLLLIMGPMIVFYVVEDWVLFSIGILILIGIALTLRRTLPAYWHQVQIYLNIGSVREGERILLDGLPWQVEQINFFSLLSNPVAELKQRVPISDLVTLKSRPARQDEPWFPCRKGDWVILADGVRGKVIGISPELVQLVERGGAQLTYQTADFLAASPRNLATNFRIKETIGISYALQRDSTTTIPETLHAYISRRINEEGYGKQLVNLRVEFERANTSSLDLVVIADFKGELGDLYNRLRRAIQRWCVDACSEHGWEIPFPQLTLHGAVATD